jgi:hypothetical protein
MVFAEAGMDREKIMKMDSFILLSWINTKLRDEFQSIDSLCGYYEFDKRDIIEKLRAIGYSYNVEMNQFR